MVRRGADEGQAEGDIDALVEGDGLDRDQGLIVGGGERHVVAGPGALMEQGVGGQRPPDVDALVLQLHHRGFQHVAVFEAHGGVLARMGVEARQDEARMREAEAVAQVMGDDPGRAHHEILRQEFGHAAERHVDRHRHHRQRLAPQHHHRQGWLRAGLHAEMGEEFGVARMGEADLGQDVLGDGLVTSAGTVPARARFTAVVIDSRVAPAFAGSGRPGIASMPMPLGSGITGRARGKHRLGEIGSDFVRSHIGHRHLEVHRARPPLHEGGVADQKKGGRPAPVSRRRQP